MSKRKLSHQINDTFENKQDKRSSDKQKKPPQSKQNHGQKNQKVAYKSHQYSPIQRMDKNSFQTINYFDQMQQSQEGMKNNEQKGSPKQFNLSQKALDNWEQRHNNVSFQNQQKRLHSQKMFEEIHNMQKDLIHSNLTFDFKGSSEDKNQQNKIKHKILKNIPAPSMNYKANGEHFNSHQLDEQLFKKQNQVGKPYNKKESNLVQQQINLKKQLVFSLVLTFIILHIYYAVAYKLQYFTVINLFLILIWVTISPHKQGTSPHKQGTSLPSVTIQDSKRSILQFIKQKDYHHSVSKPIFKLICLNLIFIDLVFFKVLIGKFLVFQDITQNSVSVSSFLSNYVDLGFVNSMGRIINNSVQMLMRELEDSANKQTVQGQFFIMSMLKVVAKFFYWIYIIIQVVFAFLTGFFTQIVLDGQYLIYLSLILISTLLAFKGFFKVNQTLERIIQNQTNPQTLFKKEVSKPQINIFNQDEQASYAKWKPGVKQTVQKSQAQEFAKKIRKVSIDSFSLIQQGSQQNVKRNKQIAEEYPVYIQFSKYLVIFTLVFMYSFCFLAEDNYGFFSDKVTMKQMWGFTLCLYSFLVVEYCKKNAKSAIPADSNDTWFKIKCWVVGLLIILLILHDFVASKNSCQMKTIQYNFLASYECLGASSRYTYNLSSFFYNSHVKDMRKSEDSFSIQIVVQYLMKAVVLLNLRFHRFYLFHKKKRQLFLERQGKSFQEDQAVIQSPNLGESSYTVNSVGNGSNQSFTARKRLTKITKSLYRNTIILLISSIITMTLTNSISNIVVLLGTFLNVPVYKQNRFRVFLMLGLTLGILLQPNQILYFVLLIIMIYIRGQDLQFRMHSHWVAIQFSRLYILFSKVSVINFIMGLIQSSTLVMYCIGFRIVFNYFNLISVFMGTQDTYARAYFYNLIPHAVIIDISLWVYMLLLRTYTPNLVNKFPNSNITNIFKEYPVIQKIQPLLKVLKIIQLVTYVTIQLIVLAQAPSIIVFVRLSLHLVIAAVDLTNQKANQSLKNLWKVNFYASLFIAFLKYFYLLNRYENLSGWLITMLDPLQRNWSIIGLWSSQGPNSIFVLLLMFFPDICIIVLSMMVEYTLQVKIFQSYRSLFILRDQNQDQINKSSNKQPEQNVQLCREPQPTSPGQQTFILAQNRQKDIQYLYKYYIKELNFKFKQESTLGRVLSDFLYDIYFILLCAIYFLLENGSSSASFWLNMPHFSIAFFVFVSQEDRKLPRKTFIFTIIYSCMTIILLYLRYLYSYIAQKGNQQNSYFYKLSDILNKYILFLVGCLFYKLHDALKDQIQLAELQKSKDRRRNLAFVLIMPAFQKGLSNTYLKQLSILWINLFKSMVLAIYACNYFTSMEVAVFNVVILLYLACIIKMPQVAGYHSQQDSLKHYWVYPFLLSFCFSLWNRDLIGYVGLVVIRLYVIFFMEFQLAVDFLFCQYVTQSQRNLVEKVDHRFKRNSLDKLSIIAEEKQGMSKLHFSSEDEDQGNNWPLINLYKTVVLTLPNFCLLLLLYSQLLLYRNYCSAFMCTFILAIVFYSIKFVQNKQIFNQGFKRIIQIYFFIFLLINSLTFADYDLYPREVEQVWLRLGVFFSCLGFVYLMYLTQDCPQEATQYCLISKAFRVTFMETRFSQAMEYWQIKSELVSQLGSQIHNQKKLLKLQKYYIRKEKVSRRVQKLIEDIQQRGRKTFNKNYSAADFEVIDQIIDYKDEGTHYELFSNMLIIMPLEDLQYCLQMMNHYYRPCVQRRNHVLKASGTIPSTIGNTTESMTREMKEIRSNVLNIYHGSIYTAFRQYRRTLRQQLSFNGIQLHSASRKDPPKPFPHQSFKGAQDCLLSSSSSSSDEEMVNFQKNQIMNEKSIKCIQRIHKKSMEVPWVWRKIIQNSEIISLVIVAGWNFFGGVYSIPANFAIFAWALVLQTKTTVFLWSFFLLYAGFIIIIKFLLHQLPSLPVLNFVFYYYPNSCYYQFVIIVVSALQIFIIKLGGTQYKTYSERQSIYDAFYRKCLNKAAHKIQNSLQSEFIQAYKILRQTSKHSFIYRVFSKSRLKPGKDFYPLMSGIQLLILLYIFFFYDMMEFQSRNNRKSLGQILTVNQFSKNMMIVLFTQVIIMILDRCIVSLNLIDIKNQALQNFLLNFAFSDHIKYRVPQDITHVGFFDFLLILKYLFHIFLIVIINFFVYFYIPSSGFTKSLIPKCQNSICGKSYTYLSVFLLLYLAYFVVSGLQIKNGFNRDKCKNKLMEKYHYVNYYIYVLFTGIPFLWEFKKICDWTITTTALPLFHWMKFQDINARLYQSKCQAEMLKIKPRAKTPWSKYFLGPSGCIFILGLIFSPLLLYSSLNPFAIKDQVLAAQIKLNLLVNGSVEYKFFSTSHAVITQNMDKFSQTVQGQFQNGSSVQSYMNLQDSNDFYLRMSSYPDQNFKISQPAIQKLSKRIQRASSGKKYRFFDMILRAKIIQRQGGQNQIQWARKRMNDSQLFKFKQFILPDPNYDNLTSQIKYFQLQNFYSPIPGSIQNKTICILTRNDGLYYQIYTVEKGSARCQNLKSQSDENMGVLLFYSSSTKYKLGFGLITFYVTYVLLISRLFRVYLTGNLDNVIYEGGNLQRMLILCDAVREARILQNLYQEQYLYAFLVDLMRNPRTLKQIAGDFTKLRAQLPLQQ